MRVAADHIQDTSPLRVIKGLRQVIIGGSEPGKGKLVDLSPLRGLALVNVSCADNPKLRDLAPLRGMSLTTLHLWRTAVVDLEPLRGMPLEKVDISGTPVSDLSPLTAAPLKELRVQGTKVSDFSPLKDMPLKHLWCDFRPERDGEVLRSIKTLETINNKPAAEVLAGLARPFPPLDPAWVKTVQSLPPDDQAKEVAAELKRRNPGFDGKVAPTIDQGGVLTELTLLTDNVTDISPVRALVGMQKLTCDGSDLGKGRLADLSPLKGMKLNTLSLAMTKVSDLSPLKDMKLADLNCHDTLVSDLTPLKDMKLTGLSCIGTNVSDLSPLKDMKLTKLYCLSTKVSDLSPLKDMKLTYLNCWSTPVSDLSPLRNMKLTFLDCGRTKVSDLSPLKGMPLTYLNCAGAPVSDLSLLKGMPLQTLHCDFKAKRDADPALDHDAEDDQRQAGGGTTEVSLPWGRFVTGRGTGKAGYKPAPRFCGPVRIRPPFCGAGL